MKREHAHCGQGLKITYREVGNETARKSNEEQGDFLKKNQSPPSADHPSHRPFSINRTDNGIPKSSQRPVIEEQHNYRESSMGLAIKPMRKHKKPHIATISGFTK